MTDARPSKRSKVPGEFYTRRELSGLGFRAIGKNASVSRFCRCYGVSGSIGDNVRIDDYVILKGNVAIGSFVHISAFCLIAGGAGSVRLEDFSGLAARVSVYTRSDNYGADALTNPMVPVRYRADAVGDVFIGRGAIVGAHSVILPGTRIGEFASIGSTCIVRGDIAPGAVCVASAAKPRAVGRKDIGKLQALADEVMADWRKRN